MFERIKPEDLAGKGVIGLPDTPKLATDEMQKKFEETAREVIVPKFNALAEQLETSAAAARIGATNAVGGESTVQQEIVRLRTGLKNTENNVEIANENAEDAVETAGEAQKKAGQAEEAAVRAKEIANEAVEEAEGAREVANQAKDTAQAAVVVAERAVEVANDAIEASELHTKRINYVNDRVTEVKSTAETAQMTASEALREATAAKNAADKADEKATAAQNAADKAMSEAENAYITVSKSLSEQQRIAARTNIKAVSYEALPTDKLTETEKAQARANIGAAAVGEGGAAAKAVLYEAQTLDDDQKTQARENIGAASLEDAENKASAEVGKHNTNTNAHADLRMELKALADRINAALDSDDTTLDELSEIVAYIKSNKSLIDAITISKVSVSDIVNDLVTNVGNRPLSAAQGVVLKALVDAVTTTANSAEKAANEANKTAGVAVRFDKIQSLSDGQKEQARANIGAVDKNDVESLIPIPDWNAGEEERGYVKNRTHWKAMEFVECIPEETLTFPADNNGIMRGSFRYRKINYDAKFRVTWDGVPYELYGRKTENTVILGNDAIVGNYPDTGEPFRIQINKNEALAYIYTANKISGVEAKHTYRLEMEELVWHKLDPEYLPDTTVSSNWKAEEGEAGYILNRSHWVEFGDEEREVIPETAVELKEQSVGGLAGFLSGAEFISGDKYFVYWNGKRYKCIGEAHGKDANGNPAVYIGNYAKLTDEGDTGEPFALVSILGGEIVAVHPMDETTELTLKVTAANKIYHKLPKEYLPDDIGGGGAQADWNAAEGEPGHVLNRTHWSDGVETVEILPPCTPMYDESEGWFFLADAPALEGGKTYTVNYNGIEYTCVGIDGRQVDAMGVVIGDVYTFSGGMLGTAPTGEPFVLVSAFDAGMQAIVIIDLTGATEVTLSIFETRENIHKLDNKYLDLDWIPKAGKPVFNGTITSTDTGELDEESFYGFSLTAGESSAFIVGGNVYEVVLDGMKYTCKGTARQEMPGAVLLGNLGFLSAPDVENTGEPFIMVSAVNFNEFDVIGSYFSDPNADEQTISLSITDVSGVKKLPEEFLPTSVPLLFNVPFTIDLAGQEAMCDLTFAEVYAKASNLNTITRCVAQASGFDQVVFGALAAISSNELSFSVAIGVDSSTAQIFTIIMHSDDTCSLGITQV